jgi:hypothetical protein
VLGRRLARSRSAGASVPLPSFRAKRSKHEALVMSIAHKDFWRSISETNTVSPRAPRTRVIQNSPPSGLCDSHYRRMLSAMEWVLLGFPCEACRGGCDAALGICPSCRGAGYAYQWVTLSQFRQISWPGLGAPDGSGVRAPESAPRGEGPALTPTVVRRDSVQHSAMNACARDRREVGGVVGERIDLTIGRG